MLEHNVTVVTTSLNLNAPFNSFIALRGLVPLHLTLAHRLPFFDNTLDLVHSMHVLSNWIPTTSLEFILFDIDRVLRPGGLFWLDHFFCIEHQLADTYIPLFRKLRYKKLRWAIGPKLDRGPDLHEVYLSALLEKPLSR
jgi:SAM-dependent methyltransferase